LAAIGATVAVWLVLHVGLHAVMAAVVKVGWGGFAILCLLGLALFVILGSAWFLLLPENCAAKIETFIWGRGVRDSAAEVLPFSQFGGFVIGARAVILRGVSAPLAFASTIVDVTTEMMAQIAYVLIGIAILVERVPKSPSSQSIANAAAIGTLLAAIGAVGFLFVQKRGFAMAERIVARSMPKAAQQAGALHDAMESIHAAPLKLLLSVCAHIAGWFASAFASWVAVRLMGLQVAFLSIVSIEALLYAIRSAAVIVPNALGVQEAAYTLLMPLFGLTASAGLALSLLKRARDVTIGIPILLAWQASEGGHALRRAQQLR
jgi:glycosyltransferase 2 family protein